MHYIIHMIFRIMNLMHEALLVEIFELYIQYMRLYRPHMYVQIKNLSCIVREI